MCTDRHSVSAVSQIRICVIHRALQSQFKIMNWEEEVCPKWSQNQRNDNKNLKEKKLGPKSFHITIETSIVFIEWTNKFPLFFKPLSVGSVTHCNWRLPRWHRIRDTDPEVRMSFAHQLSWCWIPVSMEIDVTFRKKKHFVILPSVV